MKSRIEGFNFLIVMAILLVFNLISSRYFFRVDLTEDQRFTLAEPTVDLLKNAEGPIKVEVLLEGSFPAGFKRLQNGVREVLRQFSNETDILEISYVDPNEGGIEQVNLTRKALAEKGIMPTNLRVNDGTELKEKIIYPWVIFSFQDRAIPVNILENGPGFSQEKNLNNSISLLEYKFADALNKIYKVSKASILFTTGRGELSDAQTQSLEKELRRYYLTDRMPLDSTIHISDEVKLVIVAKPRKPFSDRDKFVLDQYIMNGGRVLWLIDQLAVSLDSLATSGEFIPPPMGHELEDLFFKYGFRINNDLVLDLESTRIPQVVGMQGDKPQIELMPWFYHTLSVPSDDHPITKNLDRVNLFFPSSIDTLKTKGKVKKTVLLRSSEYSRKQMTPTRLNFEILRYKPNPDKFGMSGIPQALLLEGQFTSLFENQVTPEMLSTFEEVGVDFKDHVEDGKMIVVADGDVVKNLVGPNEKPEPLGRNKWEKFVFPGNSDFVLNAVEYLMDDTGLLQARSKDLKLRLLDKVRSQQERLYWQLLNILGPLLLLLLFGLIFNFIRKKKYAV